MTAGIAELAEEFERIRATWVVSSAEDRKPDLHELKSMLERLWQIEGVEALNLRRRVRGLIDEADHVSGRS